MSTPWRPKTLGEILGADQGDSPEAKVYRRYLELGINSEEKLRAVAAPDRYLWLVFWLQWEVDNGGIDQFLWNSKGDYAMETLEALNAIGASDAHKLLGELCALFPDGRPSEDQETRQGQMRAINARFGVEDLYDIVGGGRLDLNLTELLWEYHRTHTDSK
jgi:hypothetical protein